MYIYIYIYIYTYMYIYIYNTFTLHVHYISFEGVSDSRHPGPGAKGAALRGKSYTGFSDDYCHRPYPFVSRGTEGTDR